MPIMSYTTAINLSILDFKRVSGVNSNLLKKTINLSILDFKLKRSVTVQTVKQSINLSILDFKRVTA